MENVNTLKGEQVETGIYCKHLEIPFPPPPHTCGIIVYVFCYLVTTIFSDVILGITLLKYQIFGFIQNCTLHLEVCIKAMTHQTYVNSTLLNRQRCHRQGLTLMVWNRGFHGGAETRDPCGFGSIF